MFEKQTDGSIIERPIKLESRNFQDLSMWKLIFIGMFLIFFMSFITSSILLITNYANDCSIKHSNSFDQITSFKR